MQRLLEFFQPLVIAGGDHEHREPHGCKLPDPGEGCSLIHLISFVQHHPPGAFQDGGVIPAEFLFQGEEIHRRIAGEVQHEEEETGALDMAQKRESHPLPPVGAPDQAGNIHDREAFTPGKPGLSEIGNPRGERIVRHPGFASGEGTEEGGFSCVGKPHQRHIGQQFQLQPQDSFLSRFSGLGDPRGLPGGGGKPGVSPPPPSSPGHPKAVAGLEDLPELLPGEVVVHHGSQGYADLEVFPGAALPPIGSSGATVLRVKLPFIVEIQQCFESGIPHQIDVPSVPAISPIRAPARAKLFPQEMDHPLSSIACPDPDGHHVHKGVLFHPFTRLVRMSIRLEGFSASRRMR